MWAPLLRTWIWFQQSARSSFSMVANGKEYFDIALEHTVGGWVLACLLACLLAMGGIPIPEPSPNQPHRYYCTKLGDLSTMASKMLSRKSRTLFN